MSAHGGLKLGSTGVSVDSASDVGGYAMGAELSPPTEVEP